jgi:hypothetical protein
MSGFLSDIQKNTISHLMDKLHDTFAQEITVYKNGKKIVIASTPAYNSIYKKTNSGDSSNIEYSTISETFSARIYYIKADEEFFAAEADQYSNKSGGQNKILVPKGSVKIVIKQEAKLFMEEARRVEFDGKRFAIKSDGMPSGLAGNQFYTFYLTPMDE